MHTHRQLILGVLLAKCRGSRLHHQCTYEICMAIGWTYMYMYTCTPLINSIIKGIVFAQTISGDADTCAMVIHSCSQKVSGHAPRFSTLLDLILAILFIIACYNTTLKGIGGI